MLNLQELILVMCRFRLSINAENQENLTTVKFNFLLFLGNKMGFLLYKPANIFFCVSDFPGLQ